MINLSVITHRPQISIEMLHPARYVLVENGEILRSLGAIGNTSFRQSGRNEEMAFILATPVHIPLKSTSIVVRPFMNELAANVDL